MIREKNDQADDNPQNASLREVLLFIHEKKQVKSDLTHRYFKEKQVLHNFCMQFA